MGTVIQFPRRLPVVRPSFSDWIRARCGGARRVYRVKRRTPTFRGVPWGERTVLLLPREWDALEREYEATYGPLYQGIK